LPARAAAIEGLETFGNQHRRRRKRLAQGQGQGLQVVGRAAHPMQQDE
jgi:hypothetical protein